MNYQYVTTYVNNDGDNEVIAVSASLLRSQDLATKRVRKAVNDLGKDEYTYARIKHGKTGLDFIVYRSEEEIPAFGQVEAILIRRVRSLDPPGEAK